MLRIEKILKITFFKTYLKFIFILLRKYIKFSNLVFYILTEEILLGIFYRFGRIREFMDFNYSTFLLQDGLVETLRRTKMKFVHCLLPQHNAGCTDNKSILSVKSNQSEDNIINVPLLRSQVSSENIHQ